MVMGTEGSIMTYLLALPDVIRIVRLYLVKRSESVLMIMSKLVFCRQAMKCIPHIMQCIVFKISSSHVLVY